MPGRVRRLPEGTPVKRELAPCGTVAAYQRHVRYGQIPDNACRAAQRAYDNARRRARRNLGKAKQQAMIREAIRMLAEAMGVHP